MVEYLVLKPEIKIRSNEYMRLLGYPVHYKPSEELYDLALWAEDWYHNNGNPWFYIRRAECFDIEKTKITIGGYTFSSSRLCKRFYDSGTNEIYLAAVSAGDTCEEMINSLKHEGKVTEQFFLDAFASAAAEYLITSAAGYIQNLYAENKAVLPHFSPGYSGWNIEEQKILWQLMNENNFLIDKLKLLDSGMLKPVKSMLALIGVAPCTGKFINSSFCSECLLPDCRYRRSPERIKY